MLLCFRLIRKGGACSLLLHVVIKLVFKMEKRNSQLRMGKKLEKSVIS
jgi:hypothetical protein